ncbi:MAG: tetratricopeptide repeat protein [Sandaracinaceae bacterium]|nr:tetratricopeptide repeat protein [Sandaracinaceae bacterium]
MGRGPSGLIALIALVALVAPGSARAQDESDEAAEAVVGEAEAPRPPTPEEDARARELFQLGDQLYEHGQYDAAIDAFEEAYRLSHRPLMLFNLANAQERAGYLEAAATSLEGYVDHAPADERVAVANRIAALRERIAAAHVEPTPVESVEPTVTPEPTPAPTPAPRVQPEPSPPPPPGPDFTPAAVLLGVAGAFLVTGIGLGAGALDLRSQVDARCSETSDGRHVCPADVEPSIADDALLSGLADASFGLAAVGAALGVYFLADALSGGSERETEASIEAGGAVLPGAVAVSVRARF